MLVCGTKLPYLGGYRSTIILHVVSGLVILIIMVHMVRCMVWGHLADLFLRNRGAIGSSKVSISLLVRFQQFLAILLTRIVSVLLPIRDWCFPLITLFVDYAR